MVNDLYNPVEGIDFTCGDNKIIIYTYREDLRSLPEGVKKRVLLFCTDNSIIENIKKNFEFERKSEEYLETTASGSKIYFFKNNRVVFHSPIILDGNTSIHSQETGWIFSTRHEILKESFTKFKPLYNPIVVL